MFRLFATTSWTPHRRHPARSRLAASAPSLALCLCSLVFLSGCPSFTTLRTARALEPGDLQATGATEVLAMKAPPGKGLGGARPSLGFAARYGVVKDVDVGVKLEPVMGVTLDTTLQLRRGGFVDIALGPGIGYFETSVPVAFSSKTIEQIATSPLYTIASPSLPLLFGLNLGNGHQIVIAPRMTAWFVQPQAAQPGGEAVPGGLELFVGTSGGISFRTVRGIRLMPEIGIAAPLGWTGRREGACLGAACAPVHARAFIVDGAFAVTFGADPLAP